jgi:hypothetical protein
MPLRRDRRFALDALVAKELLFLEFATTTANRRRNALTFTVGTG